MQKFDFNLFLFEGEASGVDGAVAAEQQDGRAAEATEQIENAADSQNETVDLDAEFEELISGKYKDSFQKRTQGIVSKRLRGVKELRETVRSQQQIMDLLKERYGTDADLYKALEEDDAYLSREAEAQNMSKEQLLEKQRTQRQQRNTEAERLQEEQVRRNQEIIDGWRREAEAMKAKYGNFDLDHEFENEQFAELVVRCGVPIEVAHKVAHIDEYLQGAIAETARQVKAETAETIRARGNRPAENGLGASAAVSSSRNIKDMSTAQINDILIRAARGENVTL